MIRRIGLFRSGCGVNWIQLSNAYQSVWPLSRGKIGLGEDVVVIGRVFVNGLLRLAGRWLIVAGVTTATAWSSASDIVLLLFWRSGRRIVFPVDFGLAFPCRVALGVGVVFGGPVVPLSLGMRDDHVFFGRLLACGGVLVEGPRSARSGL